MTIDSPCRATCKLNEQDICIGCYRSMHEIANWNRLSEAEKQDAINASKQRREAHPYDEQDLASIRPITSIDYRRYKLPR